MAGASSERSDGQARAARDAPVVYRLITIAKRLAPFYAERFAPLGLHVGQDRLLMELWAEDGLSQTQLIERLGVEPPTVTGTVQRLERAGIIRREPDARNRRVSRVYLTDAGRALEKPVRAVWIEAERSVLRDLSAKERAAIAELLDRVHPPG